MSDDEFTPTRTLARSTSPRAKEAGGEGGKGKGKAGGQAPKLGQYCHEFAKTEKCPREEKFGVGKCIFPHRMQAQVDADKRAAAPAPAVPAIGVEGR